MLTIHSLVATLWLVVAAAAADVTTPVPILRQINRQNDDGSYSFGYEAADGSFKIETKHPNGDVVGKYGYVDDSGKVREISYGASSSGGFQPEGAGIVVPPPARHDPAPADLRPGEPDDGQYREDPRIYEDPKYNHPAPSASPAPSPRPFSAFPQRPFKQRVFPQEPAPAVQPQPQYHTQYRTQHPQQSLFQQPQYQQPQYQQPQYQQPQYQQPQYQQPQYQQSQFQLNQPQYQQPQYQTQYDQYRQYQPDATYAQQYRSPFDAFAGHPAQNFDPATGSYSITYSG